MEILDKLITFTCPKCATSAEYGLSITFLGRTLTGEPAPFDPANLPTKLRPDALFGTSVTDAPKNTEAPPRPPRKSAPRAATVQLETDIRTLLAFNPELTGQEIVAKTGAKQSTVYMLMRKIRSESEHSLQEGEADAVDMINVDDLVNGLVAV